MLSPKVKILVDAVAFKNRQQGKWVFTNGCFDLLHFGHITYLKEAKSLGDFLVVGINSDASVGRLKGPNRPIKDQHQRCQILAALEMVDLVVCFDEDTPLQLIEAIRPDILVKGGDYQLSEIVGHDFVRSYDGQVLSLSYLEGYSSSAFIDKIKRS